MVFIDYCHKSIINFYIRNIKPNISYYQTHFQNNIYYNYCKNISNTIYTQFIYISLYGYSKCQILYNKYIIINNKPTLVWLGYLDYLSDKSPNISNDNAQKLNYKDKLLDSYNNYLDKQLIFKKNDIVGILLPNNLTDINIIPEFDFKNECLSAVLCYDKNELDITTIYNNYARVKQNKNKKLDIRYMVNTQGENIVNNINSQVKVINNNANMIIYDKIITF